jgi:hypothetical protein
LCALLIFGCQTELSGENEIVKGSSNLKISDGVLDLSQFSQEQQKVDREQAAKRREELKEGRVVLEVNSKEKIRINSINLAVFARSVSNNIGEKIYYRNFLSNENNSNCKKFSNKNAAQIFFLENGGPKNDYHNIDVDGDGFACEWDPSIYRKINSVSKSKDTNH